MSKTMLVNVTHVEESRVAVLEDGVLAAYEIETLNRANIKGNIYNAVVESVHPSLEAAFVKIDTDLKGFLPLDEVNFRLLPVRSDSRKLGKIGQHIQPGQKLMAQVVREPFAGKPPTISTYFSLPGRFLVLMPGVDSSGISRKIEDSQQRERLKSIVDELSPPEGFGLIVRTAGIGQTKVALQRDLRYLLRLWESIQKSSKSHEFPGLVYREADLVIRTIRDHFTPDIEEVWIDSADTHEKALEFMRSVMPSRAKSIMLYSNERPLFNKFNLEEQIEKIYKRRVPLPSGGEIVIDGTEALTAIDVNSARSKRKGDIEDTVTQTNLEAAAEICRQLRLRDLGGLIVIDFIDMSQTRNKKKVEKVMKDSMRGDKAKYDITVISKLGLMELARQRIKGTKIASSYATCSVCDGYGLVKNVEAAGLAAMRKLQTRAARGDFGRLRVGLPPEVSTWLANHKRDGLLALERRHQIVIEIVPVGTLLRHEVEFSSFPREKGDEPVRLPEASPAVPAPTASQDATAAPTETRDKPRDAPADTESRDPEGTSGGRRRRGRRRRSGAPATATPTATSTTAPATDPEDHDKPAAPVPELAETGVVHGILPFAPEPTEERTAPDDAPPAEADRPVERDANGDERKPRRRRRGRRRGRGGAAAASEGGAVSGNGDAAPTGDRAEATTERGDDSGPRPTPVKPEVLVPAGVRSNELMPAASGGSAKKDRGAEDSKSPRRRRRKPR